MKRNEVFNLLLNFAEGVEADTTATRQVMESVEQYEY